MPPARPKRKLIDIVGILRMIRRDEAAMGKEPKATYRVIPVTEGGFAVEAITKGAVSHTEFGFKTEDEARAWIEAKQARNSN